MLMLPQTRVSVRWLPYNPEVTPIDYELFTKMIKEVRGKIFITDDVVKGYCFGVF